MVMTRMTSEIIVALVAFLGTVIGTLGGILASSKLISYRIEQLEKKVDEHNQFARRIPVFEERINSIDRRLETLERKVEE